ncbi:MAG: hypothetical protein Q4P71_05130 [Actinomycetaceae bacterium]|nr:hypothetical protein [Actinomycetaceae bacterium]
MTMSPTIGDQDISIDPGYDQKPRTCMYKDAVCVLPPTHVLLEARHDGGYVRTEYCARHYGLELAYFLEVHITTCRAGVRAHFAGFGEIGSVTKFDE